MIISFYGSNINKEIVENQKRIFSLFGHSIKQILCEPWIEHSKHVDDFLRSDNEWEWILIFDIDCIPLNKNILDRAIKTINEREVIFSAAQKANHIPDSQVYGGPFFIGFSRKTYEALGKTSFSPTYRSDCGGELTYSAKEKKIDIELLYPSSVEVSKWYLDENHDFGLGTTFDNSIYHSFESRFDNSGLFLKKCKEIFNAKRIIF
jgi:hypothetical protein